MTIQNNILDETSRPSGDAPDLQAVNQPSGPVTDSIISDSDLWVAALASAYAYILSDQWGQDA